jgi:hypothetical protein
LRRWPGLSRSRHRQRYQDCGRENVSCAHVLLRGW